MWIFHNFPSVVHISSISLIFLTFSQHVDWWHSPPKTLVDTADSFAAGLFEQWKKALFFSGESHEKLCFQRNSAYIWLVVWNMTLFFIIFHILGKSISSEFHIFQRSWIHQPVIIMYVYFNSSNHMYIYIIVLYVYICIYNRVLRTKWLMMVRYASETWVNIHVSYCWCGLDPWDQHLSCFHHQSHLDTDAGAVGLWSFSKPQTNITLKHILNDTV